jgi:hypothetical protein
MGPVVGEQFHQRICLPEAGRTKWPAAIIPMPAVAGTGVAVSDVWR